jgi:hypothetical protein
MWNISSSEIQLHVQLQQNAANFGAETLMVGRSGIDSNFSSNSSDPWQRLLDWMRHNGAVVSNPSLHPTSFASLSRRSRFFLFFLCVFAAK